VRKVRPTDVDEELYIQFGNKCRTERKKITDVLEKLMKLYIKKGDEIFKDL